MSSASPGSGSASVGFPEAGSSAGPVVSWEDAVASADRVAELARAQTAAFVSATRGGVDGHLIPLLLWTSSVDTVGDVVVDVPAGGVPVVRLPANPWWVAGFTGPRSAALASTLAGAALSAHAAVLRARMERFGEQAVLSAPVDGRALPGA